MTDRLIRPPGAGEPDHPDHAHASHGTCPAFRVALSSPTPSALLAEVHGELDLLTAPQLRSRLTHALTGSRHTVLVTDLTDVRFLGAAGITALLQAREHAHQRRIAFRVVATHRPVLLPLTLLDLTTTFDVHPSRAQALAAPSYLAGNGRVRREQPPTRTAASQVQKATAPDTTRRHAQPELHQARDDTTSIDRGEGMQPHRHQAVRRVRAHSSAQPTRGSPRHLAALPGTPLGCDGNTAHAVPGRRWVSELVEWKSAQGTTRHLAWTPLRFAVVNRRVSPGMTLRRGECSRTKVVWCHVHPGVGDGRQHLDSARRELRPRYDTDQARASAGPRLGGRPRRRGRRGRRSGGR
ncbi:MULTISPECIES: STAS domain-containing protein [Pseudonocardiaceae]|uniref:STAS domain-containing protein n=1 Tax=Amycolatopsis echigonensis TaxID=2576905 RepID=A0A8E2B9S6_9PSEU|nr:STAS domain-containing protein [Amycolatopsis echigonensis]RBM22321.1 hypothetical protein DI005_07425 [Prauserella sp. PE36]